MNDGGGEDARLRLAREVADTRQRVTLGGLFYLAGWIVVGGFASVYARHALLGGVIASAFLVLAALRVMIRVPAAGAPADEQQVWLDRQWMVVLATAALWGAVLTWALLDPAFLPARPAALLCSIAYATAYAHNFSMRRDRALLGIVLIYLPAPALLALDPQATATAVTMAVYFIYVLSILFRSHGEYEHRLDMDEALRRQRDQYEQLSRTDPLTGLANRRHFGVVLEQLSTQSLRAQSPLTLLVLDIDHFKRINDEHGHDAGDACLVRFAERMDLVFRMPGVHLARLGGEEFAVLLPGTGAAGAMIVAERIVQDVRGGLWLKRPVTASVGAAAVLPGDDPNRLVARADAALYAAKRAGRDRALFQSGE